MSLLWLAPSQAFFAPRLTRMVVERIVRPPLPLFGMSIPILSVRAKPSHSDQKLKSDLANREVNRHIRIPHDLRPTSTAYLGEHLHNQPGAYWCPNDCHRFTLDCSHLVEPLNAPSVILGNWLIQSVTYDEAQRILELEMNTGERFQHVGVPRRVAIALVQEDDPAKFMNECIDGTYLGLNG